MGSRRAAFAFIFATVALDMLALGVIIPVLPKLIVEFEGGDMQKAAGWTGVFGFVFALMQFVSSPVLGALSDRFGRRPVILLSNLGLGLDYIVMGFAPTVMWLLVGRVISGITSASFPTATAYIADVVPPEQRAAKFGMLGAAFGLGFIVGPAIGGLLGDIDVRLPFYFAGGLSLVNFLYGVFVLPESLPKEKRAPFALKSMHPLGSTKLLRSHPVLFGLTVAAVFAYLAHESLPSTFALYTLPSTFALYTMQRYAFGERDIGFALAAVGLSSAIVQAALTGVVVKRVGERASLLFGLVCGVLGMAMMGLAPTAVWFYASIPLQALWGLGGPPMQSIMSRAVDETQQGQLQGALSSLRGVTGMIGPLLFTAALGAGIAPGASYLVPGAAFLLAAVLLGGAAVASTIATRSR
jgi:MFS transporter, DHA1 family, tetracycline resistance protein